MKTTLKSTEKRPFPQTAVECGRKGQTVIMCQGFNVACVTLTNRPMRTRCESMEAVPVQGLLPKHYRGAVD